MNPGLTNAQHSMSQPQPPPRPPLLPLPVRLSLSLNSGIPQGEVPWVSPCQSRDPFSGLRQLIDAREANPWRHHCSETGSCKEMARPVQGVQHSFLMTTEQVHASSGHRCRGATWHSHGGMLGTVPVPAGTGQCQEGTGLCARQ